MAARRRVRTWWRKWGANPVASVILAVVLIADGFTRPRGADPTLPGMIIGALSSARVSRDSFSLQVYVVREPRGMRVIDEDTESWDELAALLTREGPPVALCSLDRRTTRAGVWSHISESTYRGIRVRPLAGAWSPEQLGQARAALFDDRTRALPCWKRLGRFEDAATGDQRSGRVLWRGVGHDAVALTLFLGLLCSFTGWRAWFADHPRSRRARGLCPACGYDLRGNEGRVCPECGRSAPRA